MRFLFMGAMFLWAWAMSAGAAAPQPGLWWSSTESGRGYAIDSQGGTLVLTVFAYGYDGRMQWYYADGPLTNNGTQWQGTLLKFDNGQPMNGAYRAQTATGNDGPVFITFTSRTTANITLPGGRTHAIERQNFGVGAPPNALLGEWIFAFSIGSSDFMDRVTFSRIVAGTVNGTGLATNANVTFGAEYQTSGAAAGQVLMVELNSSGTLLNRYIWTLQLEEGRGSWVGITSGIFYPMHVLKTRTATGLEKAAAIRPDRDSIKEDRRRAESHDKSAAVGQVTADRDAIDAAFDAMAERMRSMR